MLCVACSLAGFTARLPPVGHDAAALRAFIDTGKGQCLDSAWTVQMCGLHGWVLCLDARQQADQVPEPPNRGLVMTRRSMPRTAGNSIHRSCVYVNLSHAELATEIRERNCLSTGGRLDPSIELYVLCCLTCICDALGLRLGLGHPQMSKVADRD